MRLLAVAANAMRLISCNAVLYALMLCGTAFVNVAAGYAYL
jgi:hypothetical protein